jgi:hypothetical protein
LEWWHWARRQKRKQQGLNLSRWLQTEQKLRSRRPSWKLKIEERWLNQWEDRSGLRIGWMLPWIGSRWRCMLTSGCCHYHRWSSEPKQKMGQSLTEKSWRKPLHWPGSQKWHLDCR